MKLKIDFHVHTVYSSDGFIHPNELVAYARQRGLDGVAVTDHDCFESGLRIAKETDFLILPGVEVSSLDGHIVGLKIANGVPSKLGSEETVERIHRSGGIAVACHPIAFLKGSLGDRVTSQFDAIEVINSSAFPFAYCRKKSEEIAARLGITRVAGTDAHCSPEIGYAYTVVDAEPSVEAVLDAVRKGKCQPYGEAIPFPLRLKRELRKLERFARLDRTESAR